MLKNYFIIAWRNAWRNKLYSFINITGLAIGMSCCVVIYLYLQQELSYDKWNVKADHTYRIVSDCYLPTGERKLASTPPHLLTELKNNFPEVVSAARVVSAEGERVLAYGDKKAYAANVCFADSSIFDVFTFSVLAGNPKALLNDPYTVVMTASTARNYFGEENAIGKVMKLSDSVNVKVTGVIADVPRNSHLQFDVLVSRSTLMGMFATNKEMLEAVDNWLYIDSYTYVVLNEKTEEKEFESQLNKHVAEQTADIRRKLGISLAMELQPLTSIHLHSSREYELKPYTNSDITYVYIFSATALFILLVACCNFINLSTARSLGRSKEIGLRKVIGGRRAQLVAQFLSESVLFSLIAGLLSGLIVMAVLPVFNSFVSVPVQPDKSLFIVYTGIILCTGLLAGFYPAFLLSSFSPVASLKGVVRHGWADVLLRKGLVIFQFAVAIVLIISSAIIFRQLDFIQSRKIGMKKEQLVQLELRFPDIPKAPVMLQELMKTPGVVSGSLTNFSFQNMSLSTVLPEGADENKLNAENICSIDEHFLKTFQIDLVAGHDYSGLPADVNGFIVNETAVKAFNWKSPQQAIGKKIDDTDGHKGTVIGVVKDFNYTSLHDPIRPLVMHIKPIKHSRVTLRLQPGHIVSSMKEMQSTWTEIATNSPFNYVFLEDEFNSLYKGEQNMRSVIGMFTCLAVLIACLGLFGLTTYSIRQRVKEIGIRKVLGAGIFSIAGLLSKDFMKLVAISVIIAVPLAWLLGHKWLQDFAYKADMNWWLFAAAGIIALCMALMTVILQALKAANANPVKNLRTE
jgi:putative ABC transport system permease protein